MRKLTTEQFIEKAINKYGDKFSYEKAEYANAKIPVTITCPIHGDFQQTPSNFLHATNAKHCKKCKEDDKKVKVVCNGCGTSNSYSKSEVALHRYLKELCPSCKKLSEEHRDLLKKTGATKNTVLTIAKLVDGDIVLRATGRVLDISQKRVRVYGIKVTTSKLIHILLYGEETTKNWVIVKDKVEEGCLIPAEPANKRSEQDWLAIFAEVHGDTYSNYNIDGESVTYTCSQHGKVKQTLVAHSRGHGCSACASINKGKARALSQEAVIERFKAYHDNDYDYGNVRYVNIDTKIEIGCNTCGSTFHITPYHHLEGIGCGCKSDYGFNPTKPAVLYFLKVKGTEVYKIGITNRTVKARYSKEDSAKLEVVWEVHYDKGSLAYEKEQQLLKAYKDYVYSGEPLLKNGNTELLTIYIDKEEL